MLSTTTMRRLTADVFTNATYRVTGGMHTLATIAAINADLGGEAGVRSRIHSLGPSGSGAGSMKRARGVEIMFFGTGSDDGTLHARVWAIKRGLNEADVRSTSPDMLLTLLCTIDGTLSTAVGATGGVLVGTSERLCDALTVTGAALATAIQTAYASPAITVVTAGANLPARVIVPDTGNCDLLIETIIDTNCTGVGVLIENNT